MSIPTCSHSKRKGTSPYFTLHDKDVLVNRGDEDDQDCSGVFDQLSLLLLLLLSHTHSLSLLSCLLYTNANAKSPRSYLRIYVRTYPKRHSSKAQQRLPPSSRGFLCHQHPFSGETANRYPRMEKQQKTKPLLKASSSKNRITFLRNDRLQTHSRLREQRFMRQCDRCTFSAIAGLSSFFALDHSSTGAFAPRC